jgi:hypothetical protein
MSEELEVIEQIGGEEEMPSLNHSIILPILPNKFTKIKK